MQFLIHAVIDARIHRCAEFNVPACSLTPMVPVQQLMAGTAWYPIATTNNIISAVDLQAKQHVP